jgi:hypothetical protein
MQDISGLTFGEWTVIKDSGKRSVHREIIWICQCSCGTIREIRKKILNNEKKPRSCGCSRPKRSRKIFDSNFEKTEGCWEWKGNINTGGYGKIGTNGLAHRRSYKYFIGQIPKDRQVCHSCDNRKCVNPAHFFLGSIGDNMRDRTAKNRQAKGSRIANSILNENLVFDIRRDRLSGMAYREICDKFKISWSSVRDICKNRQWQHVPLGEECKNYKSKLDLNQKQHQKVS